MGLDDLRGSGSKKRSSGGGLASLAAKSQRSKPDTSILGQIRDIVESAPSGLVNFAAETVKDPVASTATGALLGGPVGAVVGAGVGAFGTAAEYLRTGEGPDFAATKHLAESFERTGEDIRHPTKIYRSIEKGQIVGKLLEDVGNVTIVAGGISRGLDAASRGAAAEAAAARETAVAASRAADEAAKFAEEARAAGGAAPDVAMAARIGELDANATHMASVAEERAGQAAAAVDKAGPVLRAYRIAKTIEELGGQGAMLPAKPYIWAAKQAAKPIGKFLASDLGRPIAEAIGRASDRIATWSVARRSIEQGQAETVRLTVPQTKAIAAMEKVLPDEAAQHAALLDLEAVPAGINSAVDRLRADGQHEIADQLLDELTQDPELGVSREALDIATKIHDGTLEAENPELYGQIREAQQIYRDRIAAPNEERYLDQAGIRGEPTEARAAYRQHSVEEAPGPNPTRMAETQRRFDKLRNDLEGAVEKAQERAEKATGRRLLPEGVTARQAVAADLNEAARVADAAVSRAAATPETLAQLKEYLKLPDSTPVERVTRKLADEILKARRAGSRVDPVLQAALDAGEWVAPDLRSLRLTEATAPERATVRAEAADQQVAKLGKLAGAADEQSARLAETGRIDRQMGRAEGKAAAYGKLLDDAFGAGRREGSRAAEAPAAAARAQGRQQGAVLAEGVKVGKRAAAADAALRELGAKERMLARLPELERKALEKTASELKSAPARYRPVLIVGRKVVRIGERMAAEADELVPGAGDAVRAAMAEVPTVLKDAVDHGLEPQYVIGGKLPDRGRGGGVGEPTLALQRIRHTGTEKLRETVRGPHTFRELHELNGRRLHQEVMNDSAKALKTRLGVKPDAVVGQTAGQLGIDHAVKGPVTPDARASSLGYVRVGAERGADTVYVPKALATGGEPLRKAMEDQGYVAWDPENLFAKTPADQIDGTTTFIPEATFKSFNRYFGEGKKAEAFFRKWYDKPMRAWKASVLALSPRWQVGNAIGNAILGTVGAGINPVTLGKAMKEAYGLMRREAAGEVGLIDPALLKRSVSTAELMELTPPRTRLGRLVQRSYEANGFVDDMNRVAIWLTETKRLSDRDLFNYIAKHPELAGKSMEAVRNEAAIHLSLRAAGDFTRMTPVEKQVFRRLAPFYAWLRHITQLTAKLPIYHPLRTVWALHLADLYGDPAEFPFLAGSVPGKFLGIGGPNTFINLPHLNPFSDSAGSTRNIFSNLTPAIKVPYQALTGDSFDTGGQITRAPGTGPRDAYGRPTSGPSSAGELFYALSNLFPQARLARSAKEAVLEGGVKQRYQSGQPIKIRGKALLSSPGTAGSLFKSGAQILGLPTIGEVDLPGLRKRKAERQRADAAARRRNAPRVLSSPSSSGGGGLASLRGK